MLQRRRLRLAQSVDVNDADEVVQLVVARKRHRFPHRALGALTVTQQTVHAVTAANTSSSSQYKW